MRPASKPNSSCVSLHQALWSQCWAAASFLCINPAMMIGLQPPQMHAVRRATSLCLNCAFKTSRPQTTSRHLVQRKSLLAPSTFRFASSAQAGSTRIGSTRQYFSANSSIDHSNGGLASSLGRAPQEQESTYARTSRTRGGIETKVSHGIATARLEQNPAFSQSQENAQLDRRKADETKQDSPHPSSPNAYPIRPDAPSRLTSLSSSLPKTSLKRRLALFLSLSKPNLSFLIVLTTAASYALYPVPDLLTSTATTSPSLSALTLVFLTSGTALCCASANALNMLFEPEYDAKMSRTRNRPLVRGLLSKRAALLFAIATGVIGTTALYNGVNPTVAGLGALNIALYAGVYTPMKRLSVLNTWVGAIVGGIPPLMGWAAAAGQAATGDGGPEDLLLGERNAGGWLLAALLFAWQFPHFNALSWSIRDEYRAAGYRMLVSFKPRMNARVALRYSLLMFPICFGLSFAGVTDQAFALTSSVVNAWMVRQAFRFWQHEGHKGTARGLFWASVWHLPVVMVLAMAHKKGLWEGVWRRVFGESGDEGEWLYDDEGEELQVSAAAPAALNEENRPELLTSRR